MPAISPIFIDTREDEQQERLCEMEVLTGIKHQAMVIALLSVSILLFGDESKAVPVELRV